MKSSYKYEKEMPDEILIRKNQAKEIERNDQINKGKKNCMKTQRLQDMFIRIVITLCILGILECILCG